MWMKFKIDICSFTKGSLACFFSKHEIVIPGLSPQSSEIRKDNDSSKDRQHDSNLLTYALYKCRNGKWAFFDCSKLPELLNS